MKLLYVWYFNDNLLYVELYLDLVAILTMIGKKKIVLYIWDNILHT